MRKMPESGPDRQDDSPERIAPRDWLIKGIHASADDVTIPQLVDALDFGLSIDVVAEACGSTPIGVVVAVVQWLAEHRDEITNDEHARICVLLADAVMPDND